MAKAGKRIRAAREGLDKAGEMPLEEALKQLKERSKTKFNESLDIAINLGVDPRHAEQMVRGFCVLPNGTGKTVRVAVFAKGEKADEAREAGADIVGAEDLVSEVSSGKVEFDRCIATPEMMKHMGPIGKILGPRGLMPNPKVGTVTEDVKKAVNDAKGGAVQFKVEKAGIVQAGVGKISFTENQLEENVKAFIDAIRKAKPSAAKGTYLRRIALSTTMGPGIRIDVSTV